MNFYELLYAGKNSGALSATYYELLFAKYLNPGGGDGWATYDGTLPAQYTANGDYLADYRIYGASGGVGDDSGAPYGYEVDMGVASNNLIDCEGVWTPYYAPTASSTGDNQTGSLTLFGRYYFYKCIKVKPNTVYTFSGRCSNFDAQRGYVCVGAHNGVPDTTDTLFSRFVSDYDTSFNSGNRDEIAIYLYCGTSAEGTSAYTTLQLSEGDINNFIPYSKTTTPIYIGDEPLGEDEYIDYKSGKIYRKTDNLIPVPEVRKQTDGELAVEVTDEGEWRYTVSNAIQESRECIFDVTPFTFPRGVSWGGDGVFKLWYGNGSLRIGVFFLGDDGSEDIWIPRGSGDNTYRALAHDGEFLCTKIKILAAYGQTPISGFLKPMLVNTGIDPQTFVPHVAPEDPPVPLPALPTVDGTNIVDYAGQSAAVPSRFYAKYKKG